MRPNISHEASTNSYYGSVFDSIVFFKVIEVSLEESKQRMMRG